MKVKKIAVCLTMGISFLMNTASFADSEITVKIDGNKIEFETEPQIYEGHTMVPMRKIFETLGAQVSWNDELKEVTAVREDTTIKLAIGSTQMYVGDDAVELEMPAMIVDSRTLVPLRAVSEALGTDVEWFGDTRTVEMFSQNPLAGKTLCVLGDSICFNNGGYGKIIADENGMDFINKAKGGASLADNVAWSAEDPGIRPSISKLAENIEGAVDYILIEGGVNDFWGGAPVGELTESFEGSYNTDTTAGGLEKLFNDCRTLHPEAKTAFIISHDSFTYEAAEKGFEKYYEIIKAVCDKWNVPYIDLYAANNSHTGVNVKDAEQKRTYFGGGENNPDGDATHPNELGYRVIYAEPVAKWMKTLLQ